MGEAADGAGADALEVLTFGCRLNALESEAVRARALADGMREGIVVNTCAVTAEAVRQARQAIRSARRRRPGARLVVTGCAAEVDAALFAGMDEVDLVLGNGLKAAPGGYRPAEPGERVRAASFPKDLPASPPRARPAGRVRGYLEVQNGCDHSCTFCIIPAGRGGSRSKDPDAVVAEARALVAEGVVEIVLTGVDLTSYAGPEGGLGSLVLKILKEAPELRRLRLSSIDAAEIDAELLSAFAGEPRLMPHLHLSLQAGSDLILKRMKRRHLRADALELVERVRSARPETAFGADLIAGFPTESEAHFEDTLRLIPEAGLSYVHVFPFSPRATTPAARMPPLPREVVKERAARLRAAGAAALARHLDARRGLRLACLVEAPGRARAEDFTEVDLAGAGAVGEVIEIAITGKSGRALLGRLDAPRHSGFTAPS